MPLRCATCESFACTAGRADVSPDSCPMRGDFPDYRDLYDTDERRRMAYHSARVEAEGYCRWTRVREIAEFARRMGYTRIGVAHCADMGWEAGLAARYWQGYSLEAVLPPAPACAPAEQAAFFARKATHLNVICGMCVGHDSLFLRASQAPVTSLVTRDKRLRHNPVAALYTSGSYFRRVLFGERKGTDEASFQGWDENALERAASRVGAAADGPRSRLEEAMEFARLLGARHIGFSFCSGFRNEAGLLTRVLEANGFQVSSSCCKTGAVPKEEFGIQDSEKVRPGTAEMACNPMAQAELLNRTGAELVLVMGQCVGHDTATLSRLKPPVVYLVTKDRVLAHNTVAALYEIER